MKRSKYFASIANPMALTPEQKQFLHDRTAPFLDSFGIDRPLSHLLQEAYLQGLRDAVEARNEA